MSPEQEIRAAFRAGWLMRDIRATAGHTNNAMSMLLDETDFIEERKMDLKREASKIRSANSHHVLAGRTN